MLFQHLLMCYKYYTKEKECLGTYSLFATCLLSQLLIKTHECLPNITISFHVLPSLWVLFTLLSPCNTRLLSLSLFYSPPSTSVNIFYIASSAFIYMNCYLIKISFIRIFVFAPVWNVWMNVCVCVRVCAHMCVCMCLQYKVTALYRLNLPWRFLNPDWIQTGTEKQ